ncbi:MAG: hypothetical protein M3337_02740 [Actinomycetota bacterium]|nr:hypothetical protein [Actinomycetota bacterium]
MTDVLVDTSVVVKWFHADGERDVEESRAVLEAHLDGRLGASVLDLTMCELGNVLVGALGLTADRALLEAGLAESASSLVHRLDL